MAPCTSSLGKRRWASSKAWAGIKVRLVSKQMERIERTLLPRTASKMESTVIATQPQEFALELGNFLDTVYFEVAPL